MDEKEPQVTEHGDIALEELVEPIQEDDMQELVERLKNEKPEEA